MIIKTRIVQLIRTCDTDPTEFMIADADEAFADDEAYSYADPILRPTPKMGSGVSLQKLAMIDVSILDFKNWIMP